MTYIPSPSISTKIGNNNKRKYLGTLNSRIKNVVVEEVVEEERTALDNKFKASFINSLFDTKQPNYSREEIRNVLERANEKNG